MNTTEITREVLRALTNENIGAMNKSDLAAHLTVAVQMLNTQPERGPGRKDDVLAMLQQGPAEIIDIANALNISTKNVSSQLSYLRKDGYIIHTDEKSRKYLASAEPVKPEVTETAEAQVLETLETLEAAE